jgi:predicted regulator of Ras-like GTPase activity (Roadblock/LC7/MglB family)
MKLKLAGLLRSLLGQGGNTESPAGSSAEPVRAVAAARPPVAPPPLPVDQSEPAPRSPNYASSYTPPPSPPQNVNPEQIGIPLVAIVNALPMDLKAKLIATPAPGQMILLQVDGVIGQLAFGAVKITFGELRQLAPGIFVNGGNGVYDSRPVSLPLNEILARINPALLSRRPVLQKIEVAEDIAGPFAGHGRGVTFTAQPLKGGTVPPAATPPRSVAPAPPIPPLRETRPASPINFAPPTPSVPPPAAPPRQVTPAPVPPKSEPIAFSPRQTTPLTPPVPFAEPAKPGSNGNGSNGNGSNGHGHGSPALPPFKFTAAPVPPPTTPVTPVAPAEAQPTFSVRLKELAENWPNEIKSEMVQSGLINASVPLPLPVIEPGLKRGRVTMAWKELRTLAQPNSFPSTSDDLELDLPLKVIAPAFLAAQKKLSARSPSRIAVSEEIPNLFFGFPQAEAAAPPAAPAFRPTPLPPPQNQPVENAIPAAQNPQNPNAQNAQNAQKVADTNLFSAVPGAITGEDDSALFQRTPAPSTDFLTRQMQPKEVVTQALAMPGVAGAVVAMADGLRVAGEVPAEINADTVAAFLPQIFERLNQSTRELRMGALNNVSFTVGNVPWKIFRVNSIYFAAFGRLGEGFPKAQLAQLAVGLDRKSK